METDRSIIVRNLINTFLNSGFREFYMTENFKTAPWIDIM